jgi:hypothetical protein
MVDYHTWWPLSGDPFYQGNIPENTARTNYYGADYTPHIYIDGLIDGVDSGPWEQMMLDRGAIASPLTIVVNGVQETPTTGRIAAIITNTSAAAVSGYLHFVLIEDNVAYSGSVYSHIMRDFIPTDATGELISLNPGDAISRDAAFTMTTGAPPSGWTRQNMEAIVFVQDNSTKEVLQTGRIFFELDQPELQVAGRTVEDTVGGDGNGNLDPGESVDLVFELGELNPTTATGVTGTLTTPSPYITISDAAGSWPDMAYWTTETNASDPFSLTAAANTPYGTVVPLTLTLYSNGGVYSTALAIKIGVGSPNQPIGPETYGYYAYEDVDAYPPSPSYGWIEINPNLGGAGALFALSDDQVRQLDAPFTFKYYGTNFTRMTICSNGWIAWGNQTDATPANGPIPGSAGPPNMVAGFWCDLNPSAAGGGKVYTYYDTVHHRFIVEFSGVEHYADPGPGLPETFEFIAYDPVYYPTLTGDGEITVQYNLVSDANTCTVGIENPTETDGIQYLALGELNPAATGLVAGRAIKYTTYPPNAASVNDGIRPSTILLQSRPNPVRGGAQICYDIPAAGHVTLRIFDATGAVVRTLIDGTVPAGAGRVNWDGRNDRGSVAPSGVYFYRLNGDDFSVHRKIVKQD